MSPIIPFVKELKKNRIDVKVYDPYYTPKEIKKILNVNAFRFPTDLNKFDCIVVSVDHDEFKKNLGKIFKKFKKTKFILDNNGIWEKSKKSLKKYNYHISGDNNWI